MSRRVGYVAEELYWWHNPGHAVGGIAGFFPQLTVEPCEHWENAETKRRMHSLLMVAGLESRLHRISARPATDADILRVHSSAYLAKLEALSAGVGGEAGDLATLAPGGLAIARLSAGGVLAAADAVLDGNIDCAYALVRPPGHHATREKGMGFCLLNNVAIAAQHLRHDRGIGRVAIVDYDVHHGNGTQEAFWDDNDVLFISLHQDSNYPADSGHLTETGGTDGQGATINVPLPPGSGGGAYADAMARVVLPALKRFRPDFILVSSGFDASYADPLGAMMLSSAHYRTMAAALIQAAGDLCHGRIVFAHEGGYSKEYVPFCGLAVVEELCGHLSDIADPYLPEVHGWARQSLQPAQAAVITTAARLHDLEAAVGSGGDGLAERKSKARDSIRAALEGLPADAQADVLSDFLAVDWKWTAQAQ